MKVAFITNICPHYRVKTYERFAQYFPDPDFYFFSAGEEWYWQHNHGVKSGKFHYRYLKGFTILGTRITPSLPIKLWQGNYEVFIKCINGRFALPITYLVARLKRKPFILWTGIWMRLLTPAHRLIYPLTRFIYRHSDAIVVYGEHVKQYLITEEGVQPEKIFVTTHAIDNEAYNRQVTEEEKVALRQELRIDPDQKIILYLGRLEEVKGLAYLIQAFADLNRPDSILVLAGDGSERGNLEDLVRVKDISDRVRFTGYIPVEKAILYYAIAWVYVLPSITLPTGKELWGLAVNEAFNQGLPVIATRAVGAAAGGLVKDGVNGLIVPERDSALLKQALNSILDDEQMRTRLSRMARQIIDTWDNEHMISGFRQAIEFVGKR
jgi:glycosyltransferase involved in cell wall biosynthesis